ncbi:MAG: leucyl aminopeptidase [Planctomycetota bacterium]|nr:leucyl aminopeptidase [Planctomycetota bacterium]
MSAAPKFSLAKLSQSLRADVLLVPVKVAKGKPKVPSLRGLATAARARLLELAAQYAGGSEPGAVDATVCGAGAGLKRVALVALGEKDSTPADEVRLAGAKAYKWCAGARCSRVVVAWDALREVAGEEAAQAWAEGAVLASFKYDERKAKKKDQDGVKDVLFASAQAPRGLAARLERGRKTGEAVNLARFLGHEPPNVINPVTLAQRAKGLARKAGLRCTVLDDKQIRQRRMGALWAVGSGSASKPRLIALEHAGRDPKSRPIVLVGKAITLDSGGYSLKPAASIPEMKYDKQGGMTVIGVLQACAALKVSQRVVGVIPSAENLISGEAYRPGDIITAMNGRTIEIDNTDAEGRLILADALHYAETVYKPRAMIDLATLTGAIVIALGNHATGLFASDDKLADALHASGERTGERLWRMPLWKEYRKQLDSTEADIKNTGGREGGSCTAAMFLKEFVTDQTPWAHLDIAATAMSGKATPLHPPGATGACVRMLLDYIQGQ